VSRPFSVARVRRGTHPPSENRPVCSRSRPALDSPSTSPGGLDCQSSCIVASMESCSRPMCVREHEPDTAAEFAKKVRKAGRDAGFRYQDKPNPLLLPIYKDVAVRVVGATYLVSLYTGLWRPTLSKESAAARAVAAAHSYRVFWGPCSGTARCSRDRRFDSRRDPDAGGSRESCTEASQEGQKRFRSGYPSCGICCN
jgi:hypothetical protein